MKKADTETSYKWLVRSLALALVVAISLPLLALAEATGTVNTKSLILRKSNSKTSKALQTLSKGETMEVLAKSGSWYKVRYGKYTGYVMKKYVKVQGTIGSSEDNSKSSDTTDTTSAIAALGDAPATSKPGDSGTKVKTLQKALKIMGYYTGSIDGKYGSGTTAAVKKFQKSKGMSQDGIAGSTTIKLLFGSNSKEDTYTTEELDWFKNGSSTIPKGATFEIMDCKTGKKFTVKRWSGGNHIDAEPLTADDTKTMKAIYGGSWSWKRRAILVKYDGHVYAASMNGMPHEDNTITGNNFDGHFCIHFTGSKTHGTKKVDTEHQNCVKQALKYTWK